MVSLEKQYSSNAPKQRKVVIPKLNFLGVKQNCITIKASNYKQTFKRNQQINSSEEEIPCEHSEQSDHSGSTIKSGFKTSRPVSRIQLE
jgi:hypothetical protein